MNDDPSDIVIRAIEETRIYANEFNEIVIRQGRCYCDADVVVLIPAQHLEAVISAMRKAAEQAAL